MFSLSEDIHEFSQMIGSIVDANPMDQDPLENELLSYSGDDEQIITSFEVMKEVMDAFKVFCDKVEMAWKIQEIPHTLRQRLITLDQLNQERYQKLYLMIQKHAEEMKSLKLKDIPESMRRA
jgi:hypothetical protein